MSDGKRFRDAYVSQFVNADVRNQAAAQFDRWLSEYAADVRAEHALNVLRSAHRTGWLTEGAQETLRSAGILEAQ
jgi:hypothetical protein